MKGYIPPASARSDGRSGKEQEGGGFHLSDTGYHKRREHNFLLGGKNNNNSGISNWETGRQKGFFDALLLSSLLGREGL
jgi:hypothetical protein